MTAPTPTSNPAPARATEPPKPPSTLLLGTPGSGKTDSIATLIEAGLDLFFFAIEPNALDSLLDSVRRRNLDMSKLHWMSIMPANPDLTALLDMATKIGQMTYEDLSKIKSGIGKDKTQQFLQLLKGFKNFIDEKDGRDYGSIFDFDASRAVVLDSLSGLNDMAFLQTVGYKPAPAQGEWGVAMSLELATIKHLCASLQCFFVLTGHLDKEINEASGAITITSSALGSKNAGKIMRPFSEIVLAKRGRTGQEFKWSTWELSSTVDLKSRALPISDDIKPSFTLLVDAHKRRLESVRQPDTSTLPST